MVKQKTKRMNEYSLCSYNNNEKNSRGPHSEYLINKTFNL